MSEKPLSFTIPVDELLELNDLLNRILNPVVHWDADELKMAKAIIQNDVQLAGRGLILLNKYLEPCQIIGLGDNVKGG